MNEGMAIIQGNMVGGLEQGVSYFVFVFLGEGKL